MTPADQQPEKRTDETPHLVIVPDVVDDGLDDDGLDDELSEKEQAEMADFFAVEDLLDAWDEAGWLRILPTMVGYVLESVDAPLTTRTEVLEITASLDENKDRVLLDDDLLWPVPTETAYRSGDLDLELEAELDPDFDPAEYVPDPDQLPYDEYLAVVRAAQTAWADLLQRHGEPPVESAEDLLELLVRWDLVEQGDPVGDTMEFVTDPPDPVATLPLSEETVADIIADQVGAEVSAVYDELHDFFFHSGDAELTIRIGQLADRAGTDVPQVRLAVSMLISEPESWVTAHRRGPQGEQQLTPDDVETLAEHARFILRVDRDAPGFPEHDH